MLNIIIKCTLINKEQRWKLPLERGGVKRSEDDIKQEMQ